MASVNMGIYDQTQSKEMVATKKAIYERERRRRNGEERRVAQVLWPWVLRKHPEVFRDFTGFYEKLLEKNPHTRNLTTSHDFKQFQRGEIGKHYIFVLYFLYITFSTV
jgi:hypothetical protein